MRNRIIISLLCLLSYVFGPVHAQLDVVSTGTTYTIDFDNTVSGVNTTAFAGSGIVPNPTGGRLDSDAWEVLGLSDGSLTYGSSGTTGDFARGSSAGGTSSGGIYAFFGAPISGRALGVQPAGSDMTPGSITLRCINNTGSYLNSIDFGFDLYIRNDQARSTEIDFDHHSDFLKTHTERGTDPLSYNIASMSTVSAAAAVGGGWVNNPQTGTLSGICVKPGDYFYLVWRTDDGPIGSGSRDEFAIDNITINVSGVSSPVFYSQNSGVQIAVGTSTTQYWSTQSSGGMQFKLTPFLHESEIVIQNGHTVEVRASSPRVEVNDITVEAGGRLRAQNNGINGFLRYINLHGDITCDGSIGYPSGATLGTGLAFDLEPGNHLFTGAGEFDCARIRKTGTGSSLGPCNLTFDMDVDVHWNGVGLYSNQASQDAGTNRFDIQVNAGSELTVHGIASIDGTNPTNATNFTHAGGSIVVDGTFTVGDALFMCTNNTNPALDVSLTINGTGRVNTNYIIAAGSAVSGHSLTMLDGSMLDITGTATTGDCWQFYSTLNNSYDLQDGSTIRYSKLNAQRVEQRLEYRNLILTGSGNKNVAPALGQLRIHEDLRISGTAILNPNGQDILISGSWTNYNTTGFLEGNQTVTFDDASGSSSITCGGVDEEFYHLVFDGGIVDMLCDIDVLFDLDINSRVNLNGNDIHIRFPANLTIGSSPYGMFVSEDFLHQGTISMNINTYALPVRFPFGTNDNIPIYGTFDLSSGDAGTVTMATYRTAADNTPWPTSPVAVMNMNSTTGLIPDNRDATADRFWNVTSSTGTATADLSLSIADTELPVAPYNNPLALVGQRYETSSNEWEAPGAGQVSLSGTHSPNTVTVTVPGVSTFSPWAIASVDSPLPIELLSFEAERKHDYVELLWTTATEINNSHFSIAVKDAEGELRWLADVIGSGNSNNEQNYSCIDLRPSEGWNYYTLYQTDYDGTSTEEETIAVFWTDTPQGLALVSQAWIGNNLMLNIKHRDQPYSLYIYDHLGQKLVAQEGLNTNQVEIPLAMAKSGLYLIKLSQKQVVVSERLWKFSP